MATPSTKSTKSKEKKTDYSDYTNEKLASALRGELSLHHLNAEAAREKILEAVIRLEESSASEKKIDEVRVLKAKLAVSSAKLQKIEAVLAEG